MHTHHPTPEQDTLAIKLARTVARKAIQILTNRYAAAGITPDQRILLYQLLFALEYIRTHPNILDLDK